ncbi:MAG: hypothetical protein IH987_22375 [Planctomycetes bacterium]|nr:hypothetical protein [Planctomycetota bacterium]
MKPTSSYRPDYEALDGDDAGNHEPSGFVGRPWVGIQFNCCAVYARIYRNTDGGAYNGACPRCRRPVMLRVGSGGTDSRFFVAE